MVEAVPALRPALLALGGNVGDVVAAFAAAIAALAADPDSSVVARSSVWRTKPWGKTDQPDFLNMAVAICTRAPPEDLLELCQALERQAGRERSERWGPRTLDIDIVVYDGLEIASPALTLPHPRTHERAFVLAPANEIAPQAMLRGKSICMWLEELLAREGADGCAVDEAATAGLDRALATKAVT